MLTLLIALNLTLVDRVDIVEVNHFYGDNGELVFDQIIWYRWNHNASRFDVVDWRILKDVRRRCEADKERWENDNPEGPPYVPEWIGGHAAPRRACNAWVSEWLDEKCGKWRTVRAGQFRESWTDYDPELSAREILPQEQRQWLKRP